MNIPRSATHGIVWPALPHSVNAQVFSLLYQMDQSQWWDSERLREMQMRQAELLIDHCLKTRASVPGSAGFSRKRR